MPYIILTSPYDRSRVWAGEAADVRDAVQQAVCAGIDLKGAATLTALRQQPRIRVQLELQLQWSGDVTAPDRGYLFCEAVPTRSPNRRNTAALNSGMYRPKVRAFLQQQSAAVTIAQIAADTGLQRDIVHGAVYGMVQSGEAEIASAVKASAERPRFGHHTVRTYRLKVSRSPA